MSINKYGNAHQQLDQGSWNSASEGQLLAFPTDWIFRRESALSIQLVNKNWGCTSIFGCDCVHRVRVDERRIAAGSGGGRSWARLGATLDQANISRTHVASADEQVHEHAAGGRCRGGGRHSGRGTSPGAPRALGTAAPRGAGGASLRAALLDARSSFSALVSAFVAASFSTTWIRLSFDGGFHRFRSPTAERI